MKPFLKIFILFFICSVSFASDLPQIELRENETRIFYDYQSSQAVEVYCKDSRVQGSDSYCYCKIKQVGMNTSWYHLFRVDSFGDTRSVQIFYGTGDEEKNECSKAMLNHPACVKR